MTMILRFIILLVVMTIAPVVAADRPLCGFQELTPRVFVLPGSDYAVCSAKGMEYPLTNPAMILGNSGVIIVDPGHSLQVGKLVLHQVRTLTEMPVVAVINTHIHGLYWLGNQAIMERFPDADIYAHEAMIDRVEAGEGAFWVDTIAAEYGSVETLTSLPNIPVNGGEFIEIAGVMLKIHHTGHAHTNHDLMIEVPGEHVLFLGGMVVEPEVPSQGVPADADFIGQIEATRYAIDLNATLYVPGRGEVGGVELPKRALRFLETIYRNVETYYRRGLVDYEITRRLKNELSEFEQWYDFSLLGGVISEMYLQIENRDF